jgi:hypothetical protein
MVRNSAVVKLIPFSCLSKVALVLIVLLSCAIVAYADCSNQYPGFNSSREDAVTQVTAWFGPPDKVSADHIRWPIPETTNGSSFFAILFKDNKIIGTSIFTALQGSSVAAESLLKLADDWDGSLKEEGFVFVKEGKKDDTGIKSAYKEYECKVDRRVCVRISLTKSTTSNIIATDLYTYWNDNKEK